jgi:DNA-binding transcriptional ArsR family regulator
MSRASSTAKTTGRHPPGREAAVRRDAAPAAEAPRDAAVRGIVRASDALAGVFAALGDPTRLKLVAVLCAGGAFSIAQLTAGTDISRQGVTKHLQVLADAGVVRDVKAGRERLWQLDPAQIEEARRTLEVIGRQWDVALGSLKRFVEGAWGARPTSSAAAPPPSRRRARRRCG